MTKKELNKKSKNENINFNLISMKINMILLKKNMIKRKIIFILNFHLYEYKNNNFSLINLLIEQLNYFFENLVKFIYERNQGINILKESKKKNKKNIYIKI